MQNENAIIKDRFDKVWDMIRQGGFSGDIHPEESKIRLEQDIKAGKGQYIFNLKKQDVDNIVEFALDRNDVMVPNRMGVFISLVGADGTEHLFPYIPVANGTDPSVHPFGFLNDELEALYSGYLSWNLDNTVMLSAYPMEKFKTVPKVQGAFVLNSDNEPVNEGIQSQWDIDKYMQLLIPRYTIAGTRDHKISINFPAAGKTFACTEGYTPKLVLILDGFLVKGGCEYKGGSGTNPFGNAVGQW